MSRRAGRSFEWWLFVGVCVSFGYLMLADGYLRLSTGDDRLRVARDVVPILMILVGLPYMVVHRTRIPRMPMFAGVVVLVLLTAVQVLNPASTSLSATVLAMRPHLEWLPFFIFGFVAISSARRLEILGALIVVCAAVNGAVSLYQSGLTPDQLASWGPGYETLLGAGPEGSRGEARIYVDSSGVDQIRPPGLGADIGSPGILAVMGLPIALSLVLYARQRLLRWTGLLGIPLMIVGLVTCQVRVAVIAAVVACCAYVVLPRPQGGTSSRLRAFWVAATLALAVVFIGQQGVDLDRLDSITPDQVFASASSERGGSFSLAVDYVTRYPFGAGLGTAGPGSVTGASRNAGRLSGENSFAYLIVEIGVAGMLLVLGLLVSTVVLGLRTLKRRRGEPAAAMLAGYLAFLIACSVLWLAGGVTAGPPLAPLIWTIVGVVAAMTAQDRRTFRPSPDTASGSLRPAQAGARPVVV